MTTAVRFENLSKDRDVRIELHQKLTSQQAIDHNGGSDIHKGLAGILHPGEHTILHVFTGNEFHLVEV